MNKLDPSTRQINKEKGLENTVPDSYQNDLHGEKNEKGKQIRKIE